MPPSGGSFTDSVEHLSIHPYLGVRLSPQFNSTGGSSWKPVKFRRGPATVRGPEDSRNVHSRRPLGRRPREGELGGLKPGDLTHPQQPPMSPRGGHGVRFFKALETAFPSLEEKGFFK